MDFANMTSYVSHYVFKLLLLFLKISPSGITWKEIICLSEICVYSNGIPSSRRGERFFNITQKGKFRTNDFKRGILPKHYFPAMQNETFYLHKRFVSKAYESFC